MCVRSCGESDDAARAPVERLKDGEEATAGPAPAHGGGGGALQPHHRHWSPPSHSHQVFFQKVINLKE